MMQPLIYSRRCSVMLRTAALTQCVLLSALMFLQQSASFYQDCGSKRFTRDSREGLERLSLLSNEWVPPFRLSWCFFICHMSCSSVRFKTYLITFLNLNVTVCLCLKMFFFFLFLIGLFPAVVLLMQSLQWVSFYHLSSLPWTILPFFSCGITVGTHRAFV